MLDEKDLQAISDIVNSRVSKSENLLLEEMDRVQGYLEKEIGKVKKNLEEIQQFYRIQKLENDNTALLLKMIEGMQKEIDELKKKIA